MIWAVDLGVKITDEERSLYIGSFCPAMTSLSPVENVVKITKGLQDRNNILLDGRTEEGR